MSKEPKEVVTIRLEPEVLAKVDELAAVMRLNRSEFLTAVIENTIESDEWMIRVVSSRWMKPVRDLFAKWEKGQSKRSGKGGLARD